MAVFRFRAEAVLELRRAEEAAALAAFSRAQARFREAREALAAAEAARDTARDTAAELARRGTDHLTLTWHRNWIVGLSSAADREHRAVERTSAASNDAERQWTAARRRRLALERLRERAWRRHEREQQRLEQKAMDELAALRYARRPQRDDEAPAGGS